MARFSAKARGRFGRPRPGREIIQGIQEHGRASIRVCDESILLTNCFYYIFFVEMAYTEHTQISRINQLAA